jgi:ABC-2 type transport system permease protein
MIRWLKIARAEFVRDLTTSLRYPLELLTGMFILYVLFMGLFMGAKLLAGSQALSGNLDGVVIGYTMWFFALMAINTMSIDIENEARQGTLEQVYLHAPNYLGLLWVRAVVHLAMGAGVVVLLSVAIQLTTGNWLNLTWQAVPAVILTIILTIAGLCGFGLILGGLSLTFKRIGQLSALMQFALFFLAYTELKNIPLPWRNIVAHLPLARGVDILKTLLSADGAAALASLGQPVTSMGASMSWLLIDSLAYALLGSLVFYAMERVARKGGLLGHY